MRYVIMHNPGEKLYRVEPFPVQDAPYGWFRVSQPFPTKAAAEREASFRQKRYPPKTPITLPDVDEEGA